MMAFLMLFSPGGAYGTGRPTQRNTAYLHFFDRWLCDGQTALSYLEYRTVMKWIFFSCSDVFQTIGLIYELYWTDFDETLGKMLRSMLLITQSKCYSQTITPFYKKGN